MAGRASYGVVARSADDNPRAILRNRDRATRPISLGLPVEVVADLIPNDGCARLLRLDLEPWHDERKCCGEQNEGAESGPATPAELEVSMTETPAVKSRLGISVGTRHVGHLLEKGPRPREA